MALPIYTHILNLKGLTKIFLKLLFPKGNLCGSGGGMTVQNPKYPRLSSGDTIIWATGGSAEQPLKAPDDRALNQPKPHPLNKTV